VRKVDVVIPVYRGLEETRACLASVLATIDPEWARVVVIDDCSPEPEVTAYLQQLGAAHPGLVLLENDRNLGFVATANRGMRHDTQRDVLLLNSDVEVAGDWLKRLREAAYGNDAVASLTPFSNNATIFSFPNFCEDNEPLFDLPVAQIDRVFATRFAAEDVVPAPTTVGCCMYLRRECLEAIGYFDEETFGRGYGEENDWCQRAERAGWRNYHLANCFVYHKGRVSFGDEHDPRVERAMQVLDKRYPDYHGKVQGHIAADPFRSQRTGALLALFAAQERPKVLSISHKLGGGAQQHVDELAALYRDEALFLQLTPERDGQSVTLSVFDGGRKLKDGLYFDVEREYQLLTGLLRELGVGRVHFHHTMGLHPRLWLLAQELECGHDLTVHDYFLVNGNPTLTDEGARFVSEEAPDFDSRCAAHYPLPPGVDAGQWRSNQKLLVESAERVIFPSRDCAERFRKFFRVQRSIVAWHPDYLLSQPYPQPRWRHSPDRPLRVLVVGAISREKGADLLEAVASALEGEGIEFHLLGYAYRALSGSVATHGPYDNRDAHELVASLAPDLIWYPALWPETYSYTLSIALHLGLPVVVPDIGAFAERVAGRHLSAVCPWEWQEDAWCRFWRTTLSEGRLAAAPSVPAAAGAEAECARFYRGGYLAPVPPRAGEIREQTLAGLAGHYHAGRPELSRSERLLGRIWRLSRSPLAARLISVIPFRMQQAIKRRLSSRPMHEIVRNR
jgi:GT2 family glycosyltransferase